MSQPLHSSPNCPGFLFFYSSDIPSSFGMYRFPFSSPDGWNKVWNLTRQMACFTHQRDITDLSIKGKIPPTTVSTTGLLSCLLALSTCKPAQVNNKKYGLAIANPGSRRHNFLFTCTTLFRGSQATPGQVREKVWCTLKEFFCVGILLAVNQTRRSGGGEEDEKMARRDRGQIMMVETWGRYQRQPKDQILQQEHF